MNKFSSIISNLLPALYGRGKGEGLLCLALATSLFACAEPQKQEVTGSCPSQVKTLYVFYNGEGRPADSVKVNNGQFSMTINKADSTLVQMRSDMPMDYSPATFFADGKPVTIDYANRSVKGSDLNNKLNEVYTPINKAMMEAVSIWAMTHSNPTGADKAKMDSLEESMDKYVKTQFLANKTNIIGAALLDYVVYELSFDELKDVITPNNEFSRSKAADKARQMYEALKKRAPGSMYQDLTENDLNGNPHKLSEWVGKGKYVMIDFWASWCGPCRGEMPNVVANYKKYHDKGFEIIGLSFDSKKEAWQKAVTDLGLPWIHLSDLKGWKSIAAGTYGINSIPASVLIDPTGKIVDVDLRGEKLGAKLKEIYGF